MKMTRGGSVKEELAALPTRNWYKHGFLLPPLLFFFVGAVDLLLPGPKTPSLFLWGSILLLNHLSVSLFKEKSHKIIASFAGAALAFVYLLQHLVFNA